MNISVYDWYEWIACLFIKCVYTSPCVYKCRHFSSHGHTSHVYCVGRFICCSLGQPRYSHFAFTVCWSSTPLNHNEPWHCLWLVRNGIITRTNKPETNRHDAVFTSLSYDGIVFNGKLPDGDWSVRNDDFALNAGATALWKPVAQKLSPDGQRSIRIMGFVFSSNGQGWGRINVEQRLGTC